MAISDRSTRNPNLRARKEHFLLPLPDQPLDHESSAGEDTFDSELEEDNSQEEDTSPPQQPLFRRVPPNDDETFRAFYAAKFEEMQQIICRRVCKLWIKVVQSKKQASNPYNGGKRARQMKLGTKEERGEVTRPAWWPKSGCRHIEPDHLKKHGKPLKLLREGV